MTGVNKVIIVGNLGNDPDVKVFNNGGKIANISVATSEKWTDKQTGELREKTEWHRITFSNRLADIAEQYLRKGSKVYVEGSLTTRKWTDNQGVERYSTEIRAQNMQMLDSRGSSNDSYQNNQGGYRNNPSQRGGYQNNDRGYNQGGYQDNDRGYQNNQGGYNRNPNARPQGGYQAPHQPDYHDQSDYDDGNYGNDAYDNQGLPYPDDGGYSAAAANPHFADEPKLPKKGLPNSDKVEDDDMPF